MAIQISEKFLSPRAIAALNKAPNKSQFLRDAIEYYVNRGPVNISSRIPGISDISDLRDDIKDIKELLSSIAGTTLDSAAEVSAAQPENKFKKVDSSAGKKIEKNVPQTESLIEDVPAETAVSHSKQNDRRKEIEKLLDDSIEVIFDS